MPANHWCFIYGRRVCFKAGDWILCTMIGYPIPERETCCMLFIGEILAFLLSLSVSSSIILSYALTKWYQLSTIFDGPPFSPERSFVLQAFLFLAFVFLSFIRKNSSSLLQSARIARSRESVQDSC